MNIVEQLRNKANELHDSGAFDENGKIIDQKLADDYRLIIRAHATIELMASALRNDDEKHRNEICADLEDKGVFTKIDVILAESGHKIVEFKRP